MDEIVLLWSDSTTISSAEFVKNSKFIAFYFSAHWCPPCRAFTPHLKSAFETWAHRNDGRIIFVSSDRSESEMMTYLKNEHGLWPAIPYTHSLRTSLGSRYGVQVIPALVIISTSDGSVISSNGVSEFRSKGVEAFNDWLSSCKSKADLYLVNLLRDNSEDVKISAAKTLLKLIDNVLSEPSNMKYRSIKLGNPAIESKLLPANGAFEILFSLGFDIESDTLFLPLSSPLSILTDFRNEISSLLLHKLPTIETKHQEEEEKKQEKEEKKQEEKEIEGKERKETNDKLGQSLNSNRGENEFVFKLMSEFSTVNGYQSSEARKKALAIIPLDSLRECALAVLKNENDENKSVEDEILIQLMNWFKNSFFSWVNAPPCDGCQSETKAAGVTSATEREKEKGASRVEIYICSHCSKTVRFPRYHSNPSILLETRRGRCGEWANCFALMTSALGYDTRHVMDWSDHVWIEVYSSFQKRWLHCDPCENVIDKPYLYELGWGKKLTYVIATSFEEIQDVTWRYVSNHSETKKRRTLVSESWLIATILKLSEQRQVKFSSEQRAFYNRRRILELSEFMALGYRSLTKDIENEHYSGRISGSMDWRISRGEMGLNNDWSPKEWTLTESEEFSKVFILSYDIIQDEYIRGTTGERVVGWSNGLKDVSNLFRKEESDWKMVYLARIPNSKSGFLCWELNLKSSSLSVQSVEVLVFSTVFENATVIWQLVGDQSQIHFLSPGIPFKSSQLTGSKRLFIKASLDGGRGPLAWQQAQLFRTSLESPSFSTHSFSIKVLLE